MAEGKANGELCHLRLAVLVPLVEHLSIGVVLRNADDAVQSIVEISPEKSSILTSPELVTSKVLIHSSLRCRYRQRRKEHKG